MVSGKQEPFRRDSWWGYELPTLIHRKHPWYGTTFMEEFPPTNYYPIDNITPLQKRVLSQPRLRIYLRLHSAFTMSSLFKGSAVLTRDAIGVGYVGRQRVASLTEPTAWLSLRHVSLHFQGHPRILQGWRVTEPWNEMQ